jgi:hypothetical protein
MATSLQEAANKWARKTSNVGAKWQQNTQGKAAAYCEGLAKLGVNASACMSGAGARYQQGVAATSAQGFQASIAGKEGKWMANFQNAFSS